MIRGIISVPTLNQDNTSSVIHFKHNITDYQQIAAELHGVCERGMLNALQLDQHSFSKVYWEKIVGFLYLLEPTISILALGLQEHVHVVYHLLEQVLIYSHTFKVSMVELKQSQLAREADADVMNIMDEEEEDGDAQPQKHSLSTSDGAKHSSNVRTMCIQRLTGTLQCHTVPNYVLTSLYCLTELINMFHGTFDFNQKSSVLFGVITPLIVALPSAIISASHPPTILLLIDQISRHTSCISLLFLNKEVISAIIKCISIQRANSIITKMVLEILGRLLDVNEGKELRPYTEVRTFDASYIQ
jgi:hypothetical protein